MKALLSVMLTGVLFGFVVVDRADAGDGRKGARHRRVDVRVVRRNERYFPARDVYVIRDYYRPYYRPLPPGLRQRYYRTGYLPRGWQRRVRPLPVYVERDLRVIPRGYRRGVIDGHAVVYNGSGMIIDVAVAF